MNPDSAHKSVWFVYIASLLTPFTCLLSGVIGIIYAVTDWIRTKTVR